MADVFVSYKAEDRARVAPLVRALESDGVSVWWDAHIGAGDEWRETILRHLEAAKCVMVIWSKRSVGPQGQFVRDEASRAVKRKTYLPVRIDKVDPPLGFGETQAHDLAGWKGDTSDPRYESILSTLGERFKIRAKPARSTQTEQHRVNRRTAIAGGAAGAAVVASGGAWFLLRPAAAQSRSIAVLPFANLSGDPAQTYFSDGIAEELRSDLSRISGLQVVARTSSEAMRNADAKTAATKLGVVNILTGSVRRSSTMIRVSAELVDGREGVERWSQTYDRAPGDSLQIQTDIALKVADALKLRLGEVDREALAQGGTSKAAAQDLVLQARAVKKQDDSAVGEQKALELLDSALSLDSRYGDALAFKSQIVTGSADAPSSLAERMRQFSDGERLARQAVAYAPRSLAARSALTVNLFFQLRINEALQQLAIVDSLVHQSSGDIDYLDNYAFMLQSIGEDAQALQVADRMVASDPLNPWAYHSRAMALYGLRRYAEAEVADRQAIALAPELVWPKAWRARSLMQLGRIEEAKAEFTKLHAQPGAPWFAWEAILYERQGDRDKSNRLLKQLQDLFGDSAHYQYAEVLAQQRRTDEAMKELEKAWEARDSGLASLKTETLFDPIRNDLRFQAIVKRIDFPA